MDIVGYPIRFYKYCSARTAELNIASGTIRWSSPLAFNDAFDIVRYFDFGWDLEDMRDEAISEYVRVLSSDVALIDVPQAHEMGRFRRYHEGCPPEVLRLIVAPFIDNDLKNAKLYLRMEGNKWKTFLHITRVFCVTTSPKNLLMWAHYADAFRGVVFEIDPDRFLGEPSASPLRNFNPVRYVATSPLPMQKEELLRGWTCQAPFPDRAKADHDRILSKNLVWSYEDEWRAIRTDFPVVGEGLVTDHSFPAESLAGLYLGPFIDETVAARLRGLVAARYRACRVFQAAPVRRSYEIGFTPVNDA
jgi:hypothetical protein